MFLRGTEEALSTMPFEWIREWHVYPQFTVSSEGVTLFFQVRVTHSQWMTVRSFSLSSYSQNREMDVTIHPPPPSAALTQTNGHFQISKSTQPHLSHLSEILCRMPQNTRAFLPLPSFAK